MSIILYILHFINVDIDDENSSQSSSAGYNDSLSKKSRIEEIRSNIMKNISNFYTLKWIKTIFLFVICITAAFCGLYLIIFDLIYKDLISISELNIALFQTTIWMSNVVSSLISMRYVFNYTYIDYPIKYNAYMDNMNDYFETLRSDSYIWYKNIITNFGNIEENIHFFYDSNNNIIFWENIPISYPDFSAIKSDTETFPLSLAQVLSENNALLRNQYFSYNYLINRQKELSKQSQKKKNNTAINTNNINNNLLVMNDTIKRNDMNNITTNDITSYDNNNVLLAKDNLVKINYSGFLSIENSINNLLPKMLDLLRHVPSAFQDYNIGNMKFVIIILLAYGFTMIILCFIYSIFLYLTNKNMQEGLEKVCRIKLDKIDETIKRIEQFNDKCLSKYRQRDGKNILDDTRDSHSEQNSSNSQSQSEKYRNFSEGAKYKSLKILSYSYLQVVVILLIICAILIPLYFVSYGMINDSNKILSVQNYIFGKCLTASASTVSIKCLISVCKTNTELNYGIDFVDRSQIENIVRDISNFDELSDFYNNKFLLNACAVIYDISSSTDANVTSANKIKYDECMNDTVIQSANNTDSLLKLIDETVSTIEKDKQMKIGKPYLFNENETVSFTNPLLFETSYFRDLEYVFYNYITPISDSFASVVSSSLNNYLLQQKNVIIILICVFGFIILVFAGYVAFIFTKRLIHLLSVSRCILRIIPTIVINNTAELETWIETKY